MGFLPGECCFILTRSVVFSLTLFSASMFASSVVRSILSGRYWSSSRTSDDTLHKGMAAYCGLKHESSGDCLPVIFHVVNISVLSSNMDDTFIWKSNSRDNFQVPCRFGSINECTRFVTVSHVTMTLVWQ